MTVPDAVLAADAADPLAGFQGQFTLPPGVIYLDGNSLGALPAETPARLAQVVQAQWGQDLITSWNRHDWIGVPRRIGAKIARLIGAHPDEVLACDSTSVNLFKLLAAAVRLRPGRGVILSEPGNFPTDLYVAQGVAATLPGGALRTVPVDDLPAAIDDQTAVVLLTHVHYKTGRRLDMAAITAAAHASGALVLWDLSHSAGVVPLDLTACAVDLAVGCGYKYLNGGPGAPAYLMVARRLQDQLSTPLSGWLGHAAPFAFDDAYIPAPGVDRFQCGTPSILAMTALEVGVDLALAADGDQIAAKAAALGDLFIGQVETLCAGQGFDLISPRQASARGGHVAFAHPQAYAICQALIARGVIGDFRAPDVLRLGFAPLYLSYQDVWSAGAVLAEIMATRAWDDPRFQERAAVT